MTRPRNTSALKFGIKQKILLVLIGLLALTSGLDALLASYFTNRQNEQTVYADLERDLRTWEQELRTETQHLREVALDTVGDAVILNQLAELITLELNLDLAGRAQQAREMARTLGYTKSVSLNRLQLVLRTGGFTGIGVYTGGHMSHFVSTSRAGMTVHKAGREPVWVEAPADAHGNVPLQNWPAWAETKRPFEWTFSADSLKQPTVSFHWAQKQEMLIRIAVPIEGVKADAGTDAVALPTARFVSELTIAGQARDSAPAGAPSSPAQTVALIAFVKLMGREVLEEVATKTGKIPFVVSPDGKLSQQLTDEIGAAPDLVQAARAVNQVSRRVVQRTVSGSNGSYYQAMLPWSFEGQPRLLLGLTSSRASTQQNIRQTVAAILSVASLVLLLSIAVGMFWVNRFTDPIVALTGTANKIGTQQLTQAEPGDRDAIERLHRIAAEAPDEVGDLARAFETMIGELRRSFEVLEQRVQDRTAELRQQTRYLRTLIDTLPLLAWLKDTKCHYLAANQATAKASGRTVEEMVGKSDLDLWPHELAESYRADDAEVMATRQRKTVEERLVDVQGTIVWLETYKAPVVDEDGTVLGTVGAARNISERKAAEAAREAALAEAERLARLRSEFLAQMSHELRTPLNAILGYAQILQREEDLTARQARGLAIIQESGHHLLTLIDDILDLTRIGASKLELYPLAVSLPVFLRVVADIIRVKADEKNLLFIFDAAPDLPTAVRMDDKRLRQVLLNLLCNAVKFTDHGYVALRVRRLPDTPLAPVRAAHRSQDPAIARLRFEIEDSGIGMTKEQLSRIFSPFEQVADPQRRHGGAGLGLAISRQLVQLMGTDIEVSSQPHKGSTFSFELDLPLVEGHVSLAEPQRIAIGYVGARRRILIVEDIPQSRAMLMDLLATLGFEVDEAANGEAALEKIQRAIPDLIVMDITMPLMDGLEATRRIRQMPAFAHLPIVITSASATPEDEARSLEAGADAFVRKPIDQESLLTAIAQHSAIEWTHEEIVSQPPSAHLEDEIQIPPLQEVEVLHRLALAGNMRDICDRADYLERSDARYASFARRLRGLAEKYQSQAVLALVERALARTAQDVAPARAAKSEG